MSGPLSSNEIEDVVSSVRRLVSAEPRTRPVSRDLGQDRLVLTPALRVVSDHETAPLILTVPAPDEAPAPTLDRSPEQSAPIEAEEALEAGLVEAEWEDEIWQEPDPPLAELALGAEEAEVVLAGEQAEDADAPWLQADVDWSEDDELAEVVRINAALSTEIPGEAAAAEPTGALPAEEEIIVEDEVVAVPTVEAVDPAKAIAEGPTATVEGSESDDDPAAEAAASLLFDSDGNPLTVLDEDALHDIVRQLIRQELQGALGERITRNVRKLVRAEINRALTARALD